jgi:N-acetylneuraminate synthase
MNPTVWLGDTPCGLDHPPVLVAEIGINHNGSLDDALRMIRLAKMSGAAMVKFQKRMPELCVPVSQWDEMRNTPWGWMKYIDYKKRIEFGGLEYDTIHHVAKVADIPWFASVWDKPSLEFIQKYDPPCYKIGSANLTDKPLLNSVLDTGKPFVLSTGMSTQSEIFDAMHFCEEAFERIVLCHSTSIYPCPREKLNLRFIQTLADWFDNGLVIGYSGHERGVHITPGVVGMGAAYIERHFTLDRRSWGTDQAASIEHWQFKDMADRIMETWWSLGDGVKVVYPEEEEKKIFLRRDHDAEEVAEEESQKDFAPRIGTR